MAILGPSRPFSGHFSAILTKDWLSNFIKSLCMMSGIFWHSFRVPTKGTLLKLQKWPFWAQIGHFQAIFRPFWLKIGDQILLNHFVWCQTFPDTSLEYPQRVHFVETWKMAILGPIRPFQAIFGPFWLKFGHQIYWFTFHDVRNLLAKF